MYRVYGFAGVLAIAIMAALFVLPRYTRSTKYLEPHAALAQYLVDRWSIKNDKQLDEIMQRIETRLRGKITLYNPAGKVLRSNIQPPLDPPTDDEQADLQRAKWSLDIGRIVIRSDDGSMIAVYAPDRPGFPWSYVLPLGSIILVLVGIASIWFSRRLARPLDRLADAARQFGKGDTTARAKLELADEVGDVGRAFDDMADRTAMVLHSQRQLMGDVSHELRTPLARIRVALELAIEDPVLAKDTLTDVGADLDEIDQLIGDILTTARLDSDRVQLNREATSVSELANCATRRFTARHPKRKLACATEDDHAIHCDAVLLRRALDNLLDNAAKYSEPDTEVAFAVHPHDSGESVAFEIIDRGIGMSPAQLELAFTPFWRADDSRTRRTGGVGLGLALARRIARAHGGEVTLASQPGKGTTARLEVPLT
ncbi:MAG TPA: HAMP domain-containing sensor histidine kinase [Kofleriaceae bacterium]